MFQAVFSIRCSDMLACLLTVVLGPGSDIPGHCYLLLLLCFPSFCFCCLIHMTVTVTVTVTLTVTVPVTAG